MRRVEDPWLPTAERLAKAGIDLTIGGDERTGRRYVMRDNPLDRALRKKMISGVQHSALHKYRHHWYHGGLSPILSSVDLNRIFSAEPGGMSGMAKSEGQVFHRKRWREANDALSYKSGIVVSKIVCEEESLDTAGAAIGFASKDKAITEAAKELRKAADILSELWRIG